MTGATIQKLGPDDVELAQQLLALFHHAFPGEREPPSASPKYLQRLLGRPDFHASVALCQGEVVGGLSAYELAVLATEARELFIYDVAVAASHRRQGVGRALIEFARELCASRGLSAMYVAASSDEAHAVAFYEATGLAREDVAWFTHEFKKETADT